MRVVLRPSLLQCPLYTNGVVVIRMDRERGGPQFARQEAVARFLPFHIHSVRRSFLMRGRHVESVNFAIRLKFELFLREPLARLRSNYLIVPCRRAMLSLALQSDPPHHGVFSNRIVSDPFKHDVFKNMCRTGIPQLLVAPHAIRDHNRDDRNIMPRI